MWWAKTLSLKVLEVWDDISYLSVSPMRRGARVAQWTRLQIVKAAGANPARASNSIHESSSSVTHKALLVVLFLLISLSDKFKLDSFFRVNQRARFWAIKADV